MKQILFIILFLPFFSTVYAQQIYVVNSINEVKTIDPQSLTVTNLFTVDVQQVGYITDIAFSPSGQLFAVTNGWQLFEIDTSNGDATLVTDLPNANPYTALVCNSDNELFTARIFAEELYKYDLDTSQLTLVDSGISTPGDFTFYKGNLVYPNIQNDFIKAYDGSTITNVGCSIPLIYTFVNVFADCEDNDIYAFDQFANMYRYDLETENFDLIAEFFNETGLLNGGTTMTEYMASDCPVAVLETVSCEPLGTSNFNEFGIALKSNPVDTNIELLVNLPYQLSYVLVSAEGRIISRGSVLDNTIPMGDIRPGIYFLQLSEENGVNVFSAKIAKK